MSHHLYAIVVRDEDIKPSDLPYFVRSSKEGFSIIAPAMALKHRVNTDVRRVQLMTDYFGGSGTQEAAYFDANGLITHFPDRTKGGAINGALELLGVRSEDGNDLFDAIGLGRYRSPEDLHPDTSPEDLYDNHEPQAMVSIPLEDYNNILRTLEDLANWREKTRAIDKAAPVDEALCKEMETLAKAALKLARKGILAEGNL